MRLIIILVMFFLNACKMIPQSQNDMVKIVNISVYKDFNMEGYTTVGAYTHFDDLKNKETELFNVPSADIEKIQQIINDSKKMKHFQRKHPGGLVFCEIQFSNPLYKSKVVISVGRNDVGIIDLTRRRDYVVRNPLDVQWLSEFVNRIKY